MKLSTLALVALAVLPSPALAQPGREAPPDYLIVGYLDRATVRTDGRVLLQGWNFECRSGLMPVTQRIGSLVVYYSAPARPNILAETFTVEGIGARPDVEAAYAPYCPAVGPIVGYAISATAPPPGEWTVNIAWVTFDSAGRRRTHNDARHISIR